MIAEVILNYKSKSVDKVFDYLVPENMRETVDIGSCVLVPFGKGNKQKEAYVTAVKESSRAKNLKSIIGFSKDIRLFDKKQLELIKWMREKYLVTYLDSVNAVSPSGTGIRYEEWIVLVKESDRFKTITDTLKQNGGAVEINRLMSCFETNIKTHLDVLISEGCVKKEYRDVKTVGDKQVSMAKINIESEDAAHIAERMEKQNAYVQAKMLDILSSCGELSLSDLVNFSDGSYSAVRALEKKGYIITYEKTVMREPEEENLSEYEVHKELTEEQKNVLKPLLKTVDDGVYEEYLLCGVTGSGKTEVYMRVIEETVKKGRQAIVLVPEISLTPQMVSRFKSRFKNSVAIIHSGLSLGEKYDQWKRIKNGDASIVVGARSAIFAPLSDIGAIIIDEEHEQTYKSEMSPRYDTREVASFRAAQYNALLLFASATPLVTSYYKAKCGKMKLLEMKSRVKNLPLPEVHTADLREELLNGNKSVLSKQLQEAVAHNLENKKQTILFLNRRGFSTFVSCRKCGYVAECPNCSISMTYHKYDNTLRCHYCGHTEPNPTVCPKCGSKYIRYFGGGTQKVEEEVHRLFPDASVLRMDVDTTGKKNSHARILNKFEKEKIDILIGTQMVTKGLDFPNVTLVGVISADTMLNIDDYRSRERTFSILEQVTGRAGRANADGLSIIQTYSPDNKAIQLMKEHDYETFFKEEIMVRKAMWYPPFCEMISVIFTGINEKNTAGASKYFAKLLPYEDTVKQKLQILGPIPAYVSKIKNKYIYRIIIKCENSGALSEHLLSAKKQTEKNDNFKTVTVVIDKNPNNMG